MNRAAFRLLYDKDSKNEAEIAAGNIPATRVIPAVDSSGNCSIWRQLQGKLSFAFPGADITAGSQRRDLRRRQPLFGIGSEGQHNQKQCTQNDATEHSDLPLSLPLKGDLIVKLAGKGRRLRALPAGPIHWTRLTEILPLHIRRTLIHSTPTVEHRQFTAILLQNHFS